MTTVTPPEAKPFIERVRSIPAWAIILICVVYLLSPIDVIPDFVPLLGQGDDVVVLALTIAEFIRRRKSV